MGSDRGAQQTPSAHGGEESTPQELITRYLAGSALLRDTIAGMDASQLDARPIPGKMSTREVVSHIADTERFYTGRMKQTIAGEEPLVMAGRPPDRPKPPDQPERDPARDLQLLEATREEMADELRDLPPEVWERVAMRRGDDAITLRQLLLRTALHLEGHVAAIEEKRSALGL